MGKKIGRGYDAGNKLKGKSGWLFSGNGVDEFGFTALPGGYRNTIGLYLCISFLGQWWSCTEGNLSAYAWSRDLEYGKGCVNRGSTNKGKGFSVRCVRDID